MTRGAVPGPRRARGALKAEIVAMLLAAPSPRTASELRAEFPDDERPALATVLTVLERLRRAGEVARENLASGELAFRVVREESRSTAAAMLADLLRTQDRQGALLRFAGGLDERDAEVLRAALDGDGRG